MVCRHVHSRRTVRVPRGYTIQHTVLIEPKKGKPYFAVLLSDLPPTNTNQNPSAIGFNIYD